MKNFNRFASLGECMVEFFDAGEGNWRRGFAGDTLNVAWCAKALLPTDWQVDYVTRIGQESVSEDLLKFLESVDISTDSIQRDESRTLGLYTIKTDAAGERTFDYWRSHSAARCLADDPQQLLQSLKGSDWLYLSGISAAIVEAQGRSNLLDVLAELRQNGLKVAYDPNYRPKLWESSEAVMAFNRAVAPLCDLVLPTFDDEQSACGDQSPQMTIERLLDWGAELVVVKNGAAATEVGGANVRRNFALPQVNSPVDTTGAGDSFNGAFLAHFMRGASLERSIKSAQCVSAGVVMERGALVPFTTLTQLDSE